MSKEKKNQTVEKASPLETQNIVHALAYFPYFIGAIGMFFLAKTEKKALLHHVKYSAFLALGACIGLILFRG